MESFLIGLVLGLAGAFFAFWSLRRSRPRKPGSPRVQIQSFVTSLRAVGELSVFRVRTKEIITASDHWFGEFGKKYLTWLISNKQMTMIFEFEVDFRYNLLSSDLSVTRLPDGTFHIKLPSSLHDVRILDMLLHSEGKTELLPWLMPDLIGRFFTGGFSVEAKNNLIAEARDEARRLAGGLVAAAEDDAQVSARKTFEMLARGFGAERIAVEFAPATRFQPRVDTSRIEQLAAPEEVTPESGEPSEGEES